jgi:hypothetical protein
MTQGQRLSFPHRRWLAPGWHLRFPGIVCLLGLQACVMVPRTTEVYDENCRVMSKQMDLEPVQIAAIRGCSNSGCTAALVAAGAAAAASAIISGSIVIVGNVAYWFEKQGRCLRDG